MFYHEKDKNIVAMTDFASFNMKLSTKDLDFYFHSKT